MDNLSCITHDNIGIIGCEVSRVNRTTIKIDSGIITNIVKVKSKVFQCRENNISTTLMDCVEGGIGFYALMYVGEEFKLFDLSKGDIQLTGFEIGVALINKANTNDIYMDSIRSLNALYLSKYGIMLINYDGNTIKFGRNTYFSDSEQVLSVPLQAISKYLFLDVDTFEWDLESDLSLSGRPCYYVLDTNVIVENKTSYASTLNTYLVTKDKGFDLSVEKFGIKSVEPVNFVAPSLLLNGIPIGSDRLETNVNGQMFDIARMVKLLKGNVIDTFEIPNNSTLLLPPYSILNPVKTDQGGIYFYTTAVSTIITVDNVDSILDDIYSNINSYFINKTETIALTSVLEDGTETTYNVVTEV